MTQKYDVVIVGAASLIGREIINSLEEDNFPYNKVYAADINQYIGNEISFGDKDILKIEQLEKFDFAKAKVVFFACSSYLTEEYIIKAQDNDCLIFDLSSYTVDDKNVPLIVSGCNTDYIHNKSSIIAVPSAPAYMIAKSLKNIHDELGIVSCSIAGYESVSAHGKEAMDELFNQTKSVYMNQQNEPYILPKKIAFNVIPFSDGINPSGYTDHEEAVMKEIKKIISSSVNVNYTAVTVPAFVGIGCLVDVELSTDTTLEVIKEIFSSLDDLAIIEDESEVIVISLVDVAQEDSIFISRLRMNLEKNNKFSFWVAADNLRKCSALNIVDVAKNFLNTTGVVN
jgi:aspartate-semialdehyde dehydrogenase